MLVLTRRAGERITIGDDIEVVVVSVRGDHVRLGFSAPRHITVRRSELIEQIRQENLAAAQSVTVIRGTAALERAPRPWQLKPWRPITDIKSSVTSQASAHSPGAPASEACGPRQVSFARGSDEARGE